MLHRFVVAIGAGCAAALLFAVSAQSSLLAMTLAYLAPLPIMIATLGWGLDGGAIAAAIAIAVLAGVDLDTALRRVEEHALPLESARAMKVYGQPSAINRLLILNAEPHPGRGTILLLREAIGF